MNLPVTLPDWLPWWLALLILLPACLYAVALLAMPFGVLGVKSRLSSVEARLDEIQGEIRSLSLRLPEPALRGGFDTPRREDRPPVPPRPAGQLRATAPPPRRPAWDEPTPAPAKSVEAEIPWMMAPATTQAAPPPPDLPTPERPTQDRPRPVLPQISRRPSYPVVPRTAGAGGPGEADEPAEAEMPVSPRTAGVAPTWLRARQAPPPPATEPIPEPPPSEAALDPTLDRPMDPAINQAAHPGAAEDRLTAPRAVEDRLTAPRAVEDRLTAPPPPVRVPPVMRRTARPMVRTERRDGEEENRTVRAEPRIDWPR